MMLWKMYVGVFVAFWQILIYVPQRLTDAATEAARVWRRKAAMDFVTTSVWAEGTELKPVLQAVMRANRVELRGWYVGFPTVWLHMDRELVMLHPGPNGAYVVTEVPCGDIQVAWA